MNRARRKVLPRKRAPQPTASAHRCRQGARRIRNAKERSIRWSRSRPRAHERMPRDPVARDLHPPADPDAIVALDVVEEMRERREARGPPREPAVQADGKHLR